MGCDRRPVVIADISTHSSKNALVTIRAFKILMERVVDSMPPGISGESFPLAPPQPMALRIQAGTARRYRTLQTLISCSTCEATPQQTRT